MSDDFAVDVKGLDKEYKDIHAVKGVSFTIRKGRSSACSVPMEPAKPPPFP